MLWHDGEKRNTQAIFVKLKVICRNDSIYLSDSRSQHIQIICIVYGVLESQEKKWNRPLNEFPSECFCSWFKKQMLLLLLWSNIYINIWVIVCGHRCQVQFNNNCSYWLFNSKTTSTFSFKFSSFTSRTKCRV